MARVKTISDYIVLGLGKNITLQDGTVITGAEAVSAWLFQQISYNTKFALEAVKIIMAYSEGAPKPEGKVHEAGILPSGIRPTIIIADTPDPVEINEVGDAPLDSTK